MHTKEIFFIILLISYNAVLSSSFVLEFQYKPQLGNLNNDCKDFLVKGDLFYSNDSICTTFETGVYDVNYPFLIKLPHLRENLNSVAVEVLQYHEGDSNDQEFTTQIGYKYFQIMQNRKIDENRKLKKIHIELFFSNQNKLCLRKTLLYEFMILPPLF